MHKVQVLLSTYNGERYLAEQINSLLDQEGVDINILVRDDGSTDRTVEILKRFKEAGVLDYYQGKNIKPARSFLDLINRAGTADYYAFCDQDDYWEKYKLLRAINKISIYYNQPALYFSKAELVDENLKPIKYSKYPKHAYTFGQALIKNNATGCTMVFNKMLLDIVKRYNPMFVTMHDHWVYLIALAIGAKIIFDQNSYIKYRQHSNNAVGGKRKIIKEYSHKLGTLICKNKTKSKMALELKKGYYDLMPEENRVIIDKIVNYNMSFKGKWDLIVDKNIKPIYLIDRITFIFAVLFGAF